MPMCQAMLQNQAKNITCQNVNLTWPGMRVAALPDHGGGHVPEVTDRRAGPSGAGR